MKKMIISFRHNKSRVAILENEELVEFYVEKPLKEIVGNVYNGRIVNVLPGMQAAFVDIGIEKNAFLYLGDAIPNKGDTNYENIENINKILHVGQKVTVQIKKAAFGNKGPRVTTHISLPGRCLVYMPTNHYIGISKKIIKDEERKKLKDLGDSLITDQEGLILRTKVLEVSKEQIIEDLEFLRGVWKTILDKSKNSSTPSLIYKDLDLVNRLIRDIFSEDVEQLIIDDGYQYAKIKSILNGINDKFPERVEYYQGKIDIFEAYNTQYEIDRALRRKVWLKSGGYLVIDKTEALTAIDVNTGKYVGTYDLEDTVFKINLEAAKEIAKQVRLRDIGGIIIVDFIDMEEIEHGKKILAGLSNELKKDRTKTTVLEITHLGLVEMTRKKIRQSLDNVMLRTCPVCHGEGKVISEEELYYRITKDIMTLKDYSLNNIIVIEVNPNIADYLLSNDRELVKELEQQSGKTIKIRENYLTSLNSFNLLYE